MSKIKHNSGGSRTKKKRRSYSRFSQIDGTHSFRDAVPNGYVDYPVKKRRGGKVFYFNFELAREMGLIAQDHPMILTRELSRTILDTFSLEIINEYDVIHKTPVAKKDIRPNKYMATRYLQLQHPGKVGKTSGDGRSIWNGQVRGRSGVWDISSCGTGVTCLSPATAIEKKYFKTGDKNASYGSGRSDLWDGVCAALMSDILHKNNILTERTLAVIAFDDNTSINVRTYKNLLRPAHFFLHMKQGNYEGLKGAIDYYIDRQVENKSWTKISNPKEKYQDMLRRIAEAFARAAAQFESEYIFCWLDWDGDNILGDAAIIDYGSVRQFGLYHNEYRYDDVERMSTTITEQKNQAKYIVQTFAQIADFLITGKKKNLRSFKKHSILKTFNEVFERSKNEAVLYKTGFDAALQKKLMSDAGALAEVKKFRKLYSYFEKAKSKQGRYEVVDGITWDAIFCIRDIMRELPKYYLKGNGIMDAQEFIDILKSDYATEEDLALNGARKSKVRQFQKSYWRLVHKAAALSGKSADRILKGIAGRSALINRYDRVTGDSIIHVARQIMNTEKQMKADELHQIVNKFIDQQILWPEYFQRSGLPRNRLRNRKAKKAFESMLKIVKDCREGI
jgi:uncharacterized protein YdiU (UPF0061 family)